LTVHDVDAWLRAARKQRDYWHLHAAGLWHSGDKQQEAFTALSALLLEAFEKVRVLREAVRVREQGGFDHRVGPPSSRHVGCERPS
jgi:hypothetical protein